MVTVRQGIQHDSGIPLGGIGTGSVEIRPDGLFHEWQIFNAGSWSPQSKVQPGDALKPEDVVFLLRTRDARGRVLLRYLGMKESLCDLYALPGARPVRSIRYDAFFPVVTLYYEDGDLPVEVEADFFSPFTPHDSRTAGTPGFYVDFRIKSRVTAPVEVSVALSARNPAGFGQDGRQPVVRLLDDGQSTHVTLAAEGLDENHPSTGELALSVTAPNRSYIAGAYAAERPGVVTYRTRFGFKTYSALHSFAETGAFPNLWAERAPSPERSQSLADLLKHSLFHDKFRKVSAALPDLEDDPNHLAAFLDDAADNVKELAERKIAWGDAHLASWHTLQPGEEARTLFTAGWFFPNHISPKGPKLGHMYENWFGGALDVNRTMIASYPDWRARTFGLPGALRSSSLPPALSDAVSAQLSTLVKCTWWTKNGDFGVWEGLGCCGFHTTDITYQGSFPIIALFPGLQKVQMKLGASFQRPDGRVHHLFTPDFSEVDEGFDRVDMNQQFVMLAARDYEWTGDTAYLRDLWPHIIRAMDNTAKLDTDGDGLPDDDTRRNTYDCWDFTGCPSYIGSLWLGALKAAERIAQAVGDAQREKCWREAYARGLKSFEEKLWNGQYYILWRNGASGETDECCMSDQMSGDWYAQVMGWGRICDESRARTALANIVRYNFVPGRGLNNASYPPGAAPRIAASGNYQADAAWTGIEYTVASLLIEAGMTAEGMAVVEDIHERYLSAGRYWNHIECGGHYYRAMSSWSPMISYAGFRLNAPAEEIAFNPAVNADPWACPFVTPGAWGVHTRSGGETRIEVREGLLALSSCVLPYAAGAKRARVALSGRDVPASVDADGRVSFGRQSIAAGDSLTIRTEV